MDVMLQSINQLCFRGQADACHGLVSSGLTQYFQLYVCGHCQKG